MAAEAGLDNIVQALLVAGADPNGAHTVCYWLQVLHFACINVYWTDLIIEFQQDM